MLIDVEPRSVYAPGKRRRRVYDARVTVNGQRFTAVGETAAEARALIRADVEYVATAGRAEAHGCKLYAHGMREWVFVLPSGGSMCFGAPDFAHALARVRDGYREHPDCQAFFAATATATGGDDAP